MRIDVLGRGLNLPERCACCGRERSTEMPASPGPGARITRSHAAAWRFPVCGGCVHHVARWRSAARLVSWLRFGGLGVALVATIPLGVVGLLLGVPAALGIAAVAGAARRREARALCSAECTRAGPPVLYFGSRGDVESFDFAEHGYATDFMRANLNRLVHLSSEARQLIQPDLDREAAEEAQRNAIERERARIAAEVAHDNEAFTKCVARMEAAKGPAGRRQALEGGLRALRQNHMREQLMLHASRVEVSVALAKAEGLKSPAAKLRALNEALQAVHNDAVPDHLQLELIRSLEAAIAKIEDEKNSIDMV